MPRLTAGRLRRPNPVPAISVIHLIGGGFGDSVHCVPEVPLRRPITDVDDQSTALPDHDSGSVRGSKEGGTDTSIDHAAPPMWRLLPKRRWPGELAILHHSLVTAPGGVDEYGESSRIFDLPKGSLRVGIARVVAMDSFNRGRQVRRADTPASRKNLKSRCRQRHGNTLTDAARSSCNKCSIHCLSVGEQKTKVQRNVCCLTALLPVCSQWNWGLLSKRSRHVVCALSGLLPDHALTRTWDGARFTGGLRFPFAEHPQGMAKSHYSKCNGDLIASY